jgi:hypothetical protein
MVLMVKRARLAKARRVFMRRECREMRALGEGKVG